MNDWQKSAEALRALLRDATARPWQLAPASVIIGADGKRVCSIPVRLDAHDVADTELIPAAVNALSDLLDQLDAFTAERDQALADWDEERDRLIVERDNYAKTVEVMAQVGQRDSVAAMRAGMERAALDGNDIWEALFGIMKGDVPDELTDEVFDQLATAIRAASIGAGDDGWRAIESAPKDGTRFDVWVPSDDGGYRVVDLHFRGSGLADNRQRYPYLPRWPTHWRPLPPAPASTDAEGE